MPLRITPLEERVVLDAAGLTELFFINEHLDDSIDKDAYTDASALDSETSPTPRILVISSQIHNPESLIKAAQEETRIVYYDAKTTSLQELSEKITKTLDGNKASSIGFVNHGNQNGEFYLTNNALVSNQSIKDQLHMRVFWQRVGSQLSNDGRIDLLACDLAASTEGRDLIKALEDITVSNIAASDNLTGNSPYKADWILETDGINAAVVYFNTGLLESWKGTLAVPLASDPKAGLALGFDGVDDHVLVTDNPALNIDDHLTIETWVRVLDIDSNQQTIMTKEGDQANEINYGLYITQGSLGDTYEITLSTNSFNLTTNENLEIGKWYHVAGVISTTDGGHQSLYINGNQVADETNLGFLSLSTYDRDLNIAKSTNGNYFNGNLDEMRLWDIAKNPTEIAENFDKVINTQSAGLVSYWRFNQGHGTNAYDYSGNHHHGQIKGSLVSSIEQIGNSFDFDKESWTAFENHVESTLLHSDQGGNTDGFISTHDFTTSSTVDGESNFFVAPSSFLGDLSHTYGSTLSFDLRLASSNNELNHTQDVLLEGVDKTLSYDLNTPGTDWSSYEITLDENVGWINTDTGNAASINDVQSVLSSIMGLKIRAEYLSEFAITDIDNVRISHSNANHATWVESGADIASSFTTDEDTDLILTLDGFDLDGDVIHAEISTLPSSGTLLQFNGSEITTSNRVVTDVNRRVIFRPDPDDYGIPYSSFSFTISDGTESDEVNLSIIVNAINDAPHLETNTPLFVDEGQEITIQNIHLNTSDDSDGNFTVSYNIASIPIHGTLKLLGTPLNVGGTFTQSDIDYGRLTYSHNDSESTNDNFSFTLSDHLNAISIGIHSYSISINRINDQAPNPGEDTTVTGIDNAPISIQEDQAAPNAANIRLSIPTIADPDGIAPQAIRIISIVGGNLSQSDGSNITLGSNGSILNLSTGTIDLRFTPNANHHTSAQFNYVLVDIDNSSIHSIASTATIPMGSINDPSVLSSTANTSPLNYIENAGALAVDPTLVIEDVDDHLIESASIQITNHYASDQDLLSFAETNLISSSYDPSTGTLTLSGQASLTDYQTALRSVVYMNLSEHPSVDIRTVTFTINDGDHHSNESSRDITVSRANDEAFAVPPGPGGNLLFDGNDDYVDLGNEIDLRNSDFTISFWTQRSHNGGDSVILSQTGSNFRMGYNVDNTFSVYFGSDELRTSDSYSQALWQHWTVTYDATNDTRVLYLDGISVANDSGVNFSGAGKTFVGQDANGNHHFDGFIDELRIQKDVLLNEENIQENMHTRLSGNESGLEGYWRFDERDGYVTQDLSGHERHGQLGGQPQSYEILASSYFNTSVDGWKVSASGGLSLNPNLSNSHIYLSNPDDTWSYWEAPEKFLGDQSDAYGGTFQFSARDDSTGDHSNLADVIIVGGGVTLSYNTTDLPDTAELTSYKIALHESAGWLNVSTGEQASRSDMQNALEALSDLKIRAEYLTGDDTFYLDTVMLAASHAPAWADSKAPLHRTITGFEGENIPITLGSIDLDLDITDSRLTIFSKLYQYVISNPLDAITSSNPNVVDSIMRILYGATNAESTTIAYEVSDDGTNYSEESVIPIEVIAVNNAPLITLPSIAPSISEDLPGLINGLSISDTDINETPNALMSVTLSVNHGKISLKQIDGLSFISKNTGFSQSDMTFEGSLSDINTAITSLLYIGEHNYHGNDTLHITVDDQGNTGVGGALTDNKEYTFIVSSVNDAPILEIPSLQTTTENALLTIHGITVNDLDTSNPELTVTITANSGSLSISGSSRETSKVITGTVSHLNTLLATLDYQSNLHFNGADTITVTVNDQGNEGVGGALEDSKIIPINVLELNNAPIITIPSSLTVDEDLNLDITGVSIADLDLDPNAENQPIRVTLSVSKGSVSLQQTSGLTFSTGDGSGNSSMTFTGTINEVDTALNTLTYRPNRHYNGPDSLEISVDDLGHNDTSGNALNDSASLGIIVNPITDPYVIHAPGFAQVNEETATNINGISVSDADVKDTNVETVEVSIYVNNGQITVDSGSPSTSIDLSGSYDEVNASLATLVYEGNAQFEGEDSLNITITENKSAIKTFAMVLTVDPVNDPIVISLPSALDIIEDTVSTIGPFSISDPDVTGIDTAISFVDMVLSVDHGKIALKQTTGLTIDAGDPINGSASLTFTGTIDAVNDAINNLNYSSNLNYNGNETLIFVVKDRGNTGLGGQQTTTETLGINVIPSNDAPIITLPSSGLTINEDTVLEIHGLSIHDIDFNDHADAEMEIILTADRGNLSMGSGFASSLSFTASTLAEANTQLSHLEYLSDLHDYGIATITISVNDHGFTDIEANQGSSNASAAKIGTQTFTINILPINDAPELIDDDIAGLLGIIEDDLLNHGTRVIDLLGEALTDVDIDTSEGLAIVGADTNNGSWEYTIDDGNNWIDIGNVSDNNARVLSSNDVTRVRFLPNLNFHEDASITIRAWDRSQELNPAFNGQLVDASINGDHTAFSSNSGTANISIAPINDAPVLNVNNISNFNPINEDLLAASGEALANPGTLISDLLSNNSISDVDDHALEGIGLGLAVIATDESHGSWEYTLDGGSNWEAMGSPDDTHALLLASDINTRARFIPNLHFNGFASISVRAWDHYLGSNGSHADTSVYGNTSPFSVETHDISITINAINDAPLLGDNTFTVHDLIEDTINDSGTNIPDLIRETISDHDTESLEGLAITSADSSNGNWEYTINDGSTWINFGSVEDNHVLLLSSEATSKVRFVPDQDYHGGTSFTFRAWDRTSGTNGNYIDGSNVDHVTSISDAEASVTMNVTPSNDAPFIGIPDGYLPVKEDTLLSINGVSVGDPDTKMDDSFEIEMQLSILHGNISLSQINGLTFISGSGINDFEMTFTGTVADINAALHTIEYISDANYHGDETISLRVDDYANIASFGEINLLVLDDQAITVESINDPAEITLPETQSINEDTLLSITGISIKDLDTTITPLIELKVDLSVNHGTLYLDASEVLVIEQSNKHFQIQGKVEELNAALSTIQYLGDLNYNSDIIGTPDILTLIVNDLGNTGSIYFPNGLPEGVTIDHLNDHLITTDSVEITVNPVNDAPVITTSQSSFTVNEDELLAVTGISFSDIELSENHERKVNASLSVNFGTLDLDQTLLSTLDLTFLQGDGTDDPFMTFQGTAADVNAALAALSYQGNLHYNSNYQGDDTLTITINDLGNTGLGGPIVSSQDVAIHIVSINNTPHALDIQSDSTLSNLENYTVIAELITSDVDLEDSDLHTYEILDFTFLNEYEDAFLIQGNQLYIANLALLTFENLPQQEFTFRTIDPSGEIFDQTFVISDRDPDSNYVLDPDKKLLVNKEIASYAHFMKANVTLANLQDNAGYLAGLIDFEAETSHLESALNALVASYTENSGATSTFNTTIITNSSEFQSLIDSLYA